MLVSPQTEGQTAAKSMCLVSVSELKDSPKVSKENINIAHDGFGLCVFFCLFCFIFITVSLVVSLSCSKVL